MNKLLLNNTARNHIKIFPMKDMFDDIPDDESGRIKWCEQKFKELQHSPYAKRLALYKHKLKGYQISVWELNDRFYLIQCIRNEFKTFNDVVYISKDRDDLLNIAKFLQANIEQIMSDYKSQILEARDALIKERAEELTTHGKA